MGLPATPNSLNPHHLPSFAPYPIPLPWAGWAGNREAGFPQSLGVDQGWSWDILLWGLRNVWGASEKNWACTLSALPTLTPMSNQMITRSESLEFEISGLSAQCPRSWGQFWAQSGGTCYFFNPQFVCLFVCFFNRVQFIIPAGPRQSLLLAKDPDHFLRKHYMP